MLPRSRTLPPRIHDSVVVVEDVRRYQQLPQVETTTKRQQQPHLQLEKKISEEDDDGRAPKRTGTVWTASSHIITAVIGSGVLSLAWAIAQLGWIVGPTVMLLFAVVIYFTSNLLADCYRTGDPSTGRRNYTYMDAVKANLGGGKVKLCGCIQYLNLLGVAIGYTIAASISMMAIQRSNCFHHAAVTNTKNPCHASSNVYMIVFGVVQVFFSQIPDFDQVWWLSILAAIMSFTYSVVGLALGAARVADNGGKFGGSAMGVAVGFVTSSGAMVTPAQKVWRNLQALGDIAFAYSYSIILIEIQDTLRSPPAESRTMRKATAISVVVTSVFYLLCGCMGYAAFGDDAPGNLLTGFGFYEPYWLLDIANMAIVVHLVGAYQVYCQPLFAFVERRAERRWPNGLRGGDCSIGSVRLSVFRVVWRTCFVAVTTVVAMLLPFFNDVVGILGALGFWPLTVYFPVEMYISHRRIRKWSTTWVGLQALSMACLVVSIAAAVGSIAGVLLDLKSYRPFTSTS
uniref:Amino acid transporter transmembrane domain-containing protein n=1 Tax=Leersia perrieri TaxID=77586 RepID=A0A0D9VB27_9ORYZ